MPDRGFDQLATLELGRNLRRNASQVVSFSCPLSDSRIDEVFVVDVADVVEVEGEVLLVGYCFEEGLIENEL